MATTFYKGVNITWGTGPTACTAFGSGIITNVDVDSKADELEVKNQYGTTVGLVLYDAKKEGTFEYIAADGSAASGSAVPSKPSVGDTITISGNLDTTVNQTNWIVKGVVIKQMNTDCEKVTVRATSYPSVT